MSEAGRSRRQLWGDTWKLIVEFWRAHPLATTSMVALVLLGGARTGIYVTAMGGVVDALVGGEGASGQSVGFWLAVFVLAMLLEQIYWLVIPVLTGFLNDHASYRVHRDVLERASGVPLIRFEDGVFFKRLQRASDDVGNRLLSVIEVLARQGSSVTALLSMGIALYIVHPLLVPLLVLGTAPSIWLQGRTATLVYQASRKHTTADRVRDHLRSLLTSREPAGEIRLFGVSDYLIGRWSALRASRRRDVLEATRRRSLAATAGSTIAGAAYAGGLALVTFAILRGRISVGDYVVVAQGALWLQDILRSMVGGLTRLEEQVQFVGDLFDFRRDAEREGDAPTKQALTVSPTPDKGRAAGMKVEARGVTFTYPSQSEPALKGVSLTIEPGERIAVVGANGAGKTTLVKILIGLYQPDEGTVFLDGIPIEDPRDVPLRGRIAAVFQDYARYELTARENIGFGNLALLADERALEAAALKAGADGLVRALPEGFDSYLGRSFGETELSGGEWQRVALARAFLRDADLLVLDEPTAALDPLAELALFERFIDIAEGRTAIMISHRLGAARLADRVIVVDGGAIVEDGHHDELVRLGGKYAELFRTQSQWYT